MARSTPKSNETYGLATLKREHVSIRQGKAIFDYPAKGVGICSDIDSFMPGALGGATRRALEHAVLQLLGEATAAAA